MTQTSEYDPHGGHCALGEFKKPSYTATVYQDGRQVGRVRKLNGDGRGWYLVTLHSYQWPNSRMKSLSANSVAVHSIKRVRYLINHPDKCGGIRHAAQITD